MSPAAEMLIALLAKEIAGDLVARPPGEPVEQGGEPAPAPRPEAA
jgi:hypothetical protein